MDITSGTDVVETTDSNNLDDSDNSYNTGSNSDMEPITSQIIGNSSDIERYGSNCKY